MRAVDYGLVLLDLHLPDGRGLDLLRQLRKAEDKTPVIILTARDQIRDRIEGLNAGADDYLVKPFDLDELVARILAVQRRSAAKASPTIRAGSLVIDQVDRKAWYDRSRGAADGARVGAARMSGAACWGNALEGSARRSALCVRLGNRKQCSRGLCQPVA